MAILEQISYIFKDGIELGLIWAFLALGVFISFRILNFADLTAEGSITLGSVIASTIILKNGSIILAILLGVTGGFIAGAITGILHTKFKIPPILAGIITMTGLYSINLVILGQSSVSLFGNTTLYTYLRKVITSPFIAKSITSFVILLLVTFGLYFLFGTEVGISLRATGMNEKMAKVQGVNTDRMIIFGLALSNALIALCGVLIAQSDRQSNLDLGRGVIVIGLASIIIGEIIFGKRSFKNWLISVVLGSIVFQMLIKVAITLRLDPRLLKLIQAVLIAVIFGMPVIKERFKRKDKNVEVKQCN